MATQNYLVPILLPRKEMLITKGEAAICADIASWLKVESIKGRLPYVWYHVANEWAGQNRPVYGAKQTTMGKIAGIPDYCFMGKYNSFFIEVKTGRGKLSEQQEIVKRWCDDVGVPHYVCRSLKELQKVLEIERNRTEKENIERESLLLYARMAENKELPVLRHVSENAKTVEIS